jgi:hypothetical protein
MPDNFLTDSGVSAAMCTTSCFHRSGRVHPSGGRFHLRWLRVVAVLSAAAALGACAGLGGQAGPPDAEAEARVAAATAPARPVQVTFDWDMRDRDARFNGQGVVRLDGAYRARLDLFGPRGETLSAAILEGEEMRVVPAGSEALLPPPALLWSALGVFRPPVDAPLTATGTTDGGLNLEYARDGTVWRFRFENDVLRRAEWTARGGRRTVELTGAADFGLPAQAAFRDWTEFRELTLRVTNTEERAGFTADVWILPGER